LLLCRDRDSRTGRQFDRSGCRIDDIVFARLECFFTRRASNRKNFLWFKQQLTFGQLPVRAANKKQRLAYLARPPEWRESVSNEFVSSRCITCRSRRLYIICPRLIDEQ
jgi:hypothetical protein